MLKYFYYLYFRYETNVNGEVYDNDFDLGYFSAKKKAKDAISLYVDQPGFRDHELDCFKILKVGVRFDYEVTEKSGLVLYELSHEYEVEDGGEIEMIFGLYSSKTAAKRELNKQKKKRLYSKHPDNFSIYTTTIDYTLGIWKEGFDRD